MIRSLRTIGIWAAVFALVLSESALCEHRLVKDSLAKAVDRAVEPIVEEQEAVGYAVGIVVNGDVELTRHYGWEDREKKIRVHRKSMFRWASISKTITAVAAMQLVEDGKLDLDADVRELVPEFPDKGKMVTSRLLLCHQGGIRHYSNGLIIRLPKQYDVPHPFESVILAMDDFKDSPLINTPGTKYSYSTHGFILLSAVVERAGEERFSEQVEKRICRPLRMTSMQPDYQWIGIPHRAVGYKRSGDAIEPSTDTDVSWKLGGGGYISTVTDLAKWCASVTRRDLLDKETWDLVSVPQETADGKTTSYGLGFGVSGQGRQLRVEHSGSQEKARTHMVCFPNLGVGAVAMSNSEYANPKKVTDALIELIGVTQERKKSAAASERTEIR